MIETALNKMAGKTTDLTGASAAAEELVRCSGCGHLVAVPYAGQVTCPECRHDTRWLSRFDHSKRRSVPIEPVQR